MIRFILLFSLLLCGCNRDDVTPTRQSTPAKPSAATEPAQSVLTIAGKSCTFPPAQIAIESQTQGLLVQLFSKGASPEGDHDGYYFEMTLDTPDPSQLDGAVWQFHSNSNDRADSPSAITVNHAANQLQPRDITITFHALANSSDLQASLAGTFNIFTTPTSPGSNGTVAVQATLQARRQTF